jgi:hypothetical protein
MLMIIVHRVSPVIDSDKYYEYSQLILKISELLYFIFGAWESIVGTSLLSNICSQSTNIQRKPTPTYLWNKA